MRYIEIKTIQQFEKKKTRKKSIHLIHNMYMTIDQYSWAMMKHGHKMLIIYLCEWTRPIVCARNVMLARFSFSFCWLVDWFKSLFFPRMNSRFQTTLCSNLSFSLLRTHTLCITYISCFWSLNNFSSANNRFCFTNELSSGHFRAKLDSTRLPQTHRVLDVCFYWCSNCFFPYLFYQIDKINRISFMWKTENKKKLHSKNYWPYTHEQKK